MEVTSTSRKLLETGSTFFEILISLFLLSIVLFSLITLQISGLRAAKTAYFASMAMQQIDSITEILFLGKNQSIYQRQLNEWQLQNAKILPLGRSTIIEKHSHLLVSLSWGSEHIVPCQTNSLGLSGCLQREIFY